MDRIEKQFYEAPSTTVLELRQEGVVCVSDPTPIYDNPFKNGENW